MNTLSNDPNAAGPEYGSESTEQPALKLATMPPAAAAAPDQATDRAYLEALLYGSWTQPPDLSARRPTADMAAESAASRFNDGDNGYFDDTDNPNPTPYSDEHYADSGVFNDNVPDPNC
jgi:hypothetical protein